MLTQPALTLERGRNIFSHFYNWYSLGGRGARRRGEERREMERTRDEAIHDITTSQQQAERDENVRWPV
jgi:hypothetical protein